MGWDGIQNIRRALQNFETGNIRHPNLFKIVAGHLRDTGKRHSKNLSNARPLTGAVAQFVCRATYTYRYMHTIVIYRYTHTHTKKYCIYMHTITYVYMYIHMQHMHYQPSPTKSFSKGSLVFSMFLILCYLVCFYFFRCVFRRSCYVAGSHKHLCNGK